MEKELIISRLESTIDNLKKLKPNQFKYDNFVSEIDPDTKCGTVCCVMGWYPQWYKMGFVYDKKGFLEIDEEVKEAQEVNTNSDLLRMYHGISNDLIEAMFYANERCQDQFGLPFNDWEADLTDITDLFEVVLSKIKSGELDAELSTPTI